jgi:hypothetical protein
MPRCESASAMKQPEYQQKLREGPVMVFTVRPNGDFAMGRSLLQWFIYSVAISAFVAIVCGTTLSRGAAHALIFHTAWIVAFLGYAAAHVQFSIWWGRSWLTTVKNLIDGVIYGGVTAATFTWLWPHA